MKFVKNLSFSEPQCLDDRQIVPQKVMDCAKLFTWLFRNLKTSINFRLGTVLFSGAINSTLGSLKPLLFYDMY